MIASSARFLIKPFFSNSFREHSPNMGPHRPFYLAALPYLNLALPWPTCHVYGLLRGDPYKNAFGYCCSVAIGVVHACFSFSHDPEGNNQTTTTSQRSNKEVAQLTFWVSWHRQNKPAHSRCC